jgi:phosphatidylinositol alpha 1,6-mannosyltransferase
MPVAKSGSRDQYAAYDRASLGLRKGWGFCDSDFARGSADLQRPPRVALFSGNYNYLRDGANQALNRLVRHLEHRLGAQVRVYSPTARTPAFEPEGQLVSVPSIAIPGRGEYRLALGLPKRAREDLAAFNPDVVHLSAPDLLGTAAGRWARSRSIPHTRFETYLEYYGLHWARGLATRRLARFYGRSDYVLVPTSQLLDEMRASRFGGRVRLWGRGVDHSLFHPERRDWLWRRGHGYKEDEPVVMFFSRLVLEKGIDTFIETVRTLRASGRLIRPLIVGEGPARARIERDLPGAVFTGYLSGPALGRAVASAGVVVVSADSPSARHLVRDGETGFLCSPTCSAAYAAAVTDLIASPARRLQVARAAHEASKVHSWDRSLDDALDTYREALQVSSFAVPNRCTWREDEPSRLRLEDLADESHGAGPCTGRETEAKKGDVP